MNILRRALIVFGLGALVAPSVTIAAEPVPIIISIQGMHCAGCAGKVKRNLQGVAGVASAQADAKAASATVMPQQSASPSAKALWEAVERAGYKPVKLVTPAGTFTSKPKS